MEKVLLRVKEISKHFDGVYAVNGVSLDINSGGICGLVGPNGSGKSTLFNVILGLYKPNQGAIYFNGECINNLAPHQIYAQGLVNSFQLPRLFYRLSVLDNMLIAARGQQGDSLISSLFLRRKWQEQEEELAQQAMEILEFLELSDLALSPVLELSDGQRKLLEVGRALIAKPMLLLLDEPTAGVNPTLAKKMFQKFQYLSQNGITFFIIEHGLEVLFDFASWVYVMDRGGVALEGQPKKMVNDPAFYEVYLGEK